MAMQPHTTTAPTAATKTRKKVKADPLKSATIDELAEMSEQCARLSEFSLDLGQNKSLFDTPAGDVIDDHANNVGLVGMAARRELERRQPANRDETERRAEALIAANIIGRDFQHVANLAMQAINWREGEQLGDPAWQGEDPALAALGGELEDALVMEQAARALAHALPDAEAKDGNPVYDAWSASSDVTGRIIKQIGEIPHARTIAGLKVFASCADYASDDGVTDLLATYVVGDVKDRTDLQFAQKIINSLRHMDVGIPQPQFAPAAQTAARPAAAPVLDCPIAAMLPHYSALLLAEDFYQTEASSWGLAEAEASKKNRRDIASEAEMEASRNRSWAEKREKLSHEERMAMHDWMSHQRPRSPAGAIMQAALIEQYLGMLTNPGKNAPTGERCEHAIKRMVDGLLAYLSDMDPEFASTRVGEYYAPAKHNRFVELEKAVARQPVEMDAE